MSTADQFLILSHHPVKHRFLIEQQVRYAGLIGSILLDLAHSENIILENGKIKALTNVSNLSPSHNLVLNEIYTSKRVRKIKTWISRTTKISAKVQKQILSNLEQEGIFKIHPKSFLGIKYYKSELRNVEVRNELINRFRAIIFENAVVSDSNTLLLGLIHACGLHHTISNSWSETRKCRKALKALMKSNSVAREVNKVVQETQAAIMAAVVASTVVATSSN